MHCRLSVLLCVLPLACAPGGDPAPKQGPSAEPTASPPAVASDAAPGAGAEAVKAHGGPKKARGVAYADALCRGDRNPCTCTGHMELGMNALRKIGLTPERLATGTPCLIADIDGNGHDDFVFLDEKYGHPTLAARAQVLMFDEMGLMATAPLPKRVRNLAWAAHHGAHALVEPILAKKFRFVYRDGRFVFEPWPSS